MAKKTGKHLTIAMRIHVNRSIIYYKLSDLVLLIHGMDIIQFGVYRLR